MYSFKPAAAIVKSNKDGQLYYNLRIGGTGTGNTRYHIGIDKNISKPETLNDLLVLDKNNYVIVPTIDRSTKKQKRDFNDNPIFYITKNNMKDHVHDYLVLWEIPNKFYTSVDYTVNGNVYVLAKVKQCKLRNDKRYESPALVLEVVGQCSLSWKAVDECNNTIQQKIYFDGNHWQLGDVVSTNHSNESEES